MGKQRLTPRKRLNPWELSAYSAGLRADLLNEPIDFRFHGKTVLHLVFSSVTLFQRLVDVPLTKHLWKYASVVGRADVTRMMAMKEPLFVGAEHGLARVVHQLATDDAIVNKAGFIEKLGRRSTRCRRSTRRSTCCSTLSSTGSSGRCRRASASRSSPSAPLRAIAVVVCAAHSASRPGAFRVVLYYAAYGHSFPFSI